MTLKHPAPGMGTFSSFTVAPRDLAFLVAVSRFGTPT